ncbi:MAG: hypothetical protein WEA10_06105, partial [Actinomycetota bacterium]
MRRTHSGELVAARRRREVAMHRKPGTLFVLLGGVVLAGLLAVPAAPAPSPTVGAPHAPPSAPPCIISGVHP